MAISGCREELPSGRVALKFARVTHTIQCVMTCGMSLRQRWSADKSTTLEKVCEELQLLYIF